MTVGAAAQIARYAALTLVKDGEGYIVGSPHTRDYVAIPALGGQIIESLQAGRSIEDCAAATAEAAGEPVDVSAFLTELESAGLLGPAASAPRPAPAAASPAVAPLHRLGRLLFTGPGLLAQTLLGLIGIALLLLDAGARPVYSDAIVTDAPLVSLLLVAAISTALGLGHELAHVLAAAARGVRSSMSISRRGYFVVLQTDLTDLWSLPRRSRAIPLAAGMLSDAAILGTVLITLHWSLLGDSPLILDIARAIVFIKFSGILFQFEFFMRTDVYALFGVATGCRNLWATKGAVARQLIRRPTREDLAVLAAASRREIRWARVYLVLYFPGIAWMIWYFGAFAVPALLAVVELALDAIKSGGLLSLEGAGGALALILSIGPMLYGLWGVARAAARLAAQLLHPAPVATEPG